MKKHIPTIVALLMMFVFGYVCPTWSTVTPVGLKVLGAFIGWLILVIAGKGMVIASCLAFFAFALSGYQTPAELLAAGFGSTGLLQFLYAFLLTGAFTRSGAGEVIVRWALSRKALNGRPMLFMLVWWTAMTILGALTTNVVACMMLGFSLIASIAKVVGYDIKDSWCRFMIAGTVLVGGTAGVLIPFQGVPTMSLTVFDKYAEQTGLLVDRGAYVTAVVMSSVLLILCFTFLARKVLRLDVTPLKRLNVADIVEGHTVKLSRKQVIITVIMLVSYLYPVFLMPLDKASAAYTLLNDRIGQTMFMGLAVAALALIGEKGEPYYDLEKNIGSDVMWGAIAAYALVTVAAGAVASDAAGIKDWLLLILTDAVSSMPLALVILFFALVSTFLTQVFSNMATIIIVSSIIAPMMTIFAAKGFNVSVIPAFILQGGMSAIATAGGSGFAAMMLAQPSFKGDGAAWALKKGSIMLLMLVACTFVTTMVLGYIF